MRQEGILLALVEAMHLVDEDDGAALLQPVARAVARSTASRMSFTPPSTALMLRNCASKASAISRAMVVLPVPGGPQRMHECGWPDSKAMRNGMPGPSRLLLADDLAQRAGAGARPGVDGTCSVPGRSLLEHVGARRAA